MDRRRPVVDSSLVHPRRLVAILALVLPFGCDQFQATADRAVATLTGKPVPSGSAASASDPRPPSLSDSACPDEEKGRAAGADSPDAALSCFRRAVSQESAALLLRVTCQGRLPASCKQTDATRAEAEKAMPDLKKTSWDKAMAKWEENRTVTYAFERGAGDKIVSTVVLCKIAEGGRWAVCEIGEMARDLAAKKGK
jgi:hypothetical protein